MLSPTQRAPTHPFRHAQVVSELKRTAYRPTTAILGSKAHYCIHEGVSAAATMSVDEGCDQLRDTAKGCPNNEGTMRNLVPYMSRKFEMRVRAAAVATGACRRCLLS